MRHVRSISSVCITNLSNPSFKFHESFKKNELPIWTVLDYFNQKLPILAWQNYYLRVYLPLGRKIFTYLGFSTYDAGFINEFNKIDEFNKLAAQWIQTGTKYIKTEDNTRIQCT